MKKKFGSAQIATIILALLMVIAIFVAVFSSSSKKDGKNDSDNSQNSTESTDGNSNNSDGASSGNGNGDNTHAPSLPPEPDFINPLTGLECSEAISKQRPVAISVNNIKEGCPQDGISQADLIYECNAEGGITRLLCFFQDYANIEQVGSIRSTRDYFLDFVQNHDAMLFHFGGSDEAYKQLKQRPIDNFDAMGYLGSYFYQDNWRINNLGSLHSWVINGKNILSAIQRKGNVRTGLNDNFKSPLSFVPYGANEAPDGVDAKCVYLPFSYYQSPYLKYDESTNTYKRWQYNQPHVDRTNSKQLEFTNVLVLFCYQSGALDAKGHIEVDLTGTGEGYYISEGKKIDVKWSKTDGDTPLKLYNTDNSPLEINRGKTYIAVMSNSAKDKVELNYNK